jgi:hypothetical protein
MVQSRPVVARERFLAPEQTKTQVMPGDHSLGLKADHRPSPAGTQPGQWEPQSQVRLVVPGLPVPSLEAGQ